MSSSLPGKVIRGGLACCAARLASRSAALLAALSLLGEGVVAIWGSGGVGVRYWWCGTSGCYEICSAGAENGCYGVMDAANGVVLGIGGPPLGPARDDSAGAESALLLHQVLVLVSSSACIACT